MTLSSQCQLITTSVYNVIPAMGTVWLIGDIRVPFPIRLQGDPMIVLCSVHME